MTNEKKAPSSLAGGDVERLSKVYAEATGYYVEFHRGLSSPSADSIRTGVRAVLAALSPEAPARKVGALDKHIADAAERDRRERDKAFRGEPYEPLTPRHEAPAEGAWIEWSGGENPVRGQSVEVKLRDGSIGPESEGHWHHDPRTGTLDDIVAYRRVSSSAPAEGAGEAWGAYARAICESEGKDWAGLDNSREDCQRWFRAGRACAALRARSSAPKARDD